MLPVITRGRLEPPEHRSDQATGQPEIIETGKRAMRGHTDGGEEEEEEEGRRGRGCMTGELMEG